MKFNWGHGIAIALILFMSFIVVLVVKMFQTPLAIYEPDYYELGENQEERIIAQKNASEVFYDFNWSENRCEFKFNQSGFLTVVKFLHLADDHNDFEIALNTENQPTQTQTIEIPKLSRGLWVMEVSGFINQQPFFIKKQFVR
jgi:hypothetical protein